MGGRLGAAAVCGGAAETAGTWRREFVRSRIFGNPTAQASPAAGPQRDPHVDNLRPAYGDDDVCVVVSGSGIGGCILHSMQHGVDRRFCNPRGRDYRPWARSDSHGYSVYVSERCECGLAVPHFYFEMATSVARRRVAHIYGAVCGIGGSVHSGVCNRRGRVEAGGSVQCVPYSIDHVDMRFLHTGAGTLVVCGECAYVFADSYRCVGRQHWRRN